MSKEINSQLFKQAIVDAKQVGAVALANAKASLDEAFNQRFQAVFAEKLREDSATEDSVVAPTMEETVEPKDATPKKSDATVGWSKDNKGNWNIRDKNMTPDSIPAAKDGGDKTKGWSSDNKGNAMDGTPNGVTENSELPTDPDVNADLEEIIRELEAEAGVTPEPAPVEYPNAGLPTAPPVPPAPPVDPMAMAPGGAPGACPPPAVGAPIAPPLGGSPIAPPPVPPVPPVDAAPVPGPEQVPNQPPTDEMGEEIDINELIASLNEVEDDKKEKEEKKDDDDDDDKKKFPFNETYYKSEIESLKAQLNEAIATVKFQNDTINEVNLLNSKLLYTNMLFKQFNMNTSQKMKIVESFDLARTIREVKMTYANWGELCNFNGDIKKKPVTSSEARSIVEGLSKKSVLTENKSQPIISSDVNEMANRFQKLAGIKKK